ncbi:MAG TPA: bifunctional adenosylcobinamide kinase/adenosylcobinamide-phosphate guanylyltransferase [Actinomycetota bacterium]|nr:bifunctional adenosylcobinamide kinase/adenosylcobinamide-phosphate guanylyltransferase [Actinomycetota bacterium]
MGLTVLLGGARSGKSELATRLASATEGPVSVVVTAEARDEEMTERIRRHREVRPVGWTTVEAPLGLASALGDVSAGAFVVLDCLSLWVSNVMEAGIDGERIVKEAREIATGLAHRDAAAVVISNEVGLGIVPVNALARRYRDTLGRVNATFVREAEHAYFVVAGKALALEDVDLS